MTTLSLIKDGIVQDNFFPILTDTDNISQDIITQDVHQILNSIRYNIIVLEDKLVKAVHTYLNGKELCEIVNCSFSELFNIDKTVSSKGIIILKKRTGLFKKIEYQITSLWDY